MVALALCLWGVRNIYKKTMKKVKAVVEELNGVSNDAKDQVEMEIPFTVEVQIQGTTPFLFHRWSNEAVAAQAAAKKNSKVKKSDNVESYVFRNDKNSLCIPAEYVRMALINSAKYDQHPQKPRASAFDLFKAGIVCSPELCPLNDGEVYNWDFMDMRRVVIQRASITRSRPAMKTGYTIDLEITSLLPDLIDFNFLNKTLIRAGQLIGIGDFRPSFGRFTVTKFKLKK